MADTATQTPDAPPAAGLFADKAELRRILDAQNALTGFVPDPTATHARVQKMVADDLRAAGLRPEDNDASCAIIAAREDY